MDRLFEVEASTRPGGPGALVGKTVGHAKIALQEAEIAGAVLAAFNQVAGTKFAGQSWLRKIILRVREHPEVSVDEHRAIIERNFERPWWRDDPSPSVIYGNDAVFERSMLCPGGKPEARTQAERKSDRIRKLAS